MPAASLLAVLRAAALALQLLGATEPVGGGGGKAAEDAKGEGEAARLPGLLGAAALRGSVCDDDALAGGAAGPEGLRVRAALALLEGGPGLRADLSREAAWAPAERAELNLWDSCKARLLLASC